MKNKSLLVLLFLICILSVKTEKCWALNSPQSIQLNQPKGSEQLAERKNTNKLDKSNQTFKNGAAVIGQVNNIKRNDSYKGLEISYGVKSNFTIQDVLVSDTLSNGDYKIRYTGRYLSASKGIGQNATFDQEADDLSQIWRITKNLFTGGYVFYNVSSKLYLNEYGLLNPFIINDKAAKNIVYNGIRFSIQQKDVVGGLFFGSKDKILTVIPANGYSNYFTFDFIKPTILNPFVHESDSTRIRVACVGNSITTGINNYPTTLSTMLGKHYIVGNFGVGGKTVTTNSSSAYVNTVDFTNAKNFLPDIVTIKLGTNDSKSSEWVSDARFEADLRSLIASFKTLRSNPEIILCLPVPAISSDIRNSLIRSNIDPIIIKVGADLGMKVIDLYTPLLSYPLSFWYDGVHPNIEGGHPIAEILYTGITGKIYDYKQGVAYFTPTAKKYYSIINKATGKSLAVKGIQAVTIQVDSTKSQVFTIEQAYYGRYNIKEAATKTYLNTTLITGKNSAQFGQIGSNQYQSLHLFLPAANPGEYFIGTDYGNFYTADSIAGSDKVFGTSGDVNYSDRSVWKITENIHVPRINIPGSFNASDYFDLVNTSSDKMRINGPIIEYITNENECYYQVTVTHDCNLNALLSATTNSAITILKLTFEDDSNSNTTYSISKTLQVTTNWFDYKLTSFNFTNVPAGKYKLHLKIISTSGSYACNIGTLTFSEVPNELQQPKSNNGIATIYSTKGSLNVNAELNTRVKIYNLLGVEFCNSRMMHTVFSTSLKKGIYIVNVQNASGTKVQKVYVN